MRVEVSATNSDYTPESNAHNGLWGEFGLFNVASGSKLHLLVKFFDRNGVPKKLPKSYMSFFYLDMHDHGNSVEYVKLKGFQRYHLATGTTVDVSKDGDSFSTFTATAPGRPNDSPKNATTLTSYQRSKAVTVEFNDVESFEAEFGCQSCTNARYFSWIGRPSILCAENPSGNPVTTTVTTEAPPTTTTVASTTTTLKENNAGLPFQSSTSASQNSSETRNVQAVE